MTSRQSSRKKVPLKEVPDVVFDSSTNRVFTKGRFLGKGGFARCFELIDNASKDVYAGKVVSKTLLVKRHQKEKMMQEVAIHRKLSHPHVVRMEGCFEDVDNVYVLLELCERRSLMELHKRRRAVTEPEARYFIHQIVLACDYLHSNKIIHRDLKLGNLFLNDEMQVKIGDFGLATILDFDGERKMTLCGTPNYISPEMLDKKGHSFEVDIWAIGCILFTLLVGKPPFETETLKDTYTRIKNNQYNIPPRIGKNAASLISHLLAPDPSRRPRVSAILKTPFFTEGFLPPRLPTSCLTLAPKFNTEAVSGGHGDILRMDNANRKSPSGFRSLATVPEQHVLKSQKQDATSVVATEKAPGERADYINELFSQLTSLQNSDPDRFNEEDLVEVQDPAATPVYWVSKWVDYSDKYGLGYQLCDNSVGVLFNDTTKIILDAAGEQIQYIEKNNAEHYYVLSRYPATLEKKVTLLRYFRAYMNENLLKTGANIPKREGDELARLPCLSTWFRTKSAIVLHFSNGTLQINFFHDHSKLIVCPLMGAATYINGEKSVATYKFSLLERYGCPKELWTRLKYTKVMVERLMSRNLSSAPGSLSTVVVRSQSQGGLGHHQTGTAAAAKFV